MKIFRRTLRILLLTLLYIPIWILGSMAMAGAIPETPSDPGLVDAPVGMLLLAIINTILIVSLIVSSRWRGWRLALLLGLSYYGSFTLITQLETWYFLSETAVSPELLLRLFLMGLPIPFLFIPLAVRLCGRWKHGITENKNMITPRRKLIFKMGIIAVVYVVIYWCAGYFIAWQNPDLRAFYGTPGPIVPFWQHTINTLSDTPDLFILQLVRGLLFALIAMPVIMGSNATPWRTALLVGFLLAVPHLVHILPNPIMPNASVRFSHMIETAASTFLFGLIIAWLLHRRHDSVRDLVA
jgi:hypothetical protein